MTIFRGLGFVVFLANSVIYLFPWPPESLFRGFIAFSFVALAFIFGAQAIGTWRSGLEADADGLRITKMWKSTLIPWEDVTRIAGNVRAPHTTRVIITTTDGEETSLNLATGHQELLDRWAAG